jgi:hypothetical protein
MHAAVARGSVGTEDAVRAYRSCGHGESPPKARVLTPAPAVERKLRKPEGEATS